MSADKRAEYLDVLELPPDATPMEIKTSFLQLKELYTKGSIAIAPMESEYPEEARQEILDSLEEAYEWLSTDPARHLYESANAAGSSNSGATAAVRKEAAEIEVFDGATLKGVRERLGIDLGEVEFLTKISMQHIKNIEAGRYDVLPEEVFVRGYITSYAKCLGLDQSKVSTSFLSVYREARNESSAE